MQKEYQTLWDKCVAFHGHACGGLAIGFRAALYAMELLEAAPAKDEELVCVAECDACGVDAIQALLGCTVGKGNLLFSLRGKQAFSFYRRSDGKGVRLVLRDSFRGNREKRLSWLMDGDYREMFDVKPVRQPLPEKARIFRSCTCALCGESMAEDHARLQDGNVVCEDCYLPYTRGF